MKGEENNPGIIPLSLKEINQYRKEHSDIVIQMKISYLEIYNEQVNDLLEPKNKNLQLQEITYGKTSQRNVIIKDLSRKITTSPSEAIKLFEIGEKNRQFAETKMNPQSSRSHCIFKIDIEIRGKNRQAVKSKIYLVDLAGSESYQNINGAR